MTMNENKFDDPGVQVLLDEVNNGKEANGLLKHPGFKLVLESLEQDANDAWSNLVTVEYDKSDDIRKLQNTVWRYRELVTRIHQLIAIGQDAERSIVEEFDGEL